MQTMPGENGRGLSRKHVLASIDASLERLGLEYVDLYPIHRWDLLTPIEETMDVLHDVVKAGKARYIGASSMYAWQFAKAQRVATTPFVSMQNLYDLVYREEERACLTQSLATRKGTSITKARGGGSAGEAPPSQWFSSMPLRFESRHRPAHRRPWCATS
jgi:aryl-alcohol dehydrogenase-like predicted oxidoreductase